MNSFGKIDRYCHYIRFKVWYEQKFLKQLAEPQ